MSFQQTEIFQRHENSFRINSASFPTKYTKEAIRSKKGGFLPISVK